MGKQDPPMSPMLRPVRFPDLRRRKPRDYVEWSTLRRWGKIPPWEEEPAGYLLRLVRETAGLTQARLARRIGCSQQAVAQAERWASNPTVGFARRWARAVGTEFKLSIEDPRSR